MKKNSITRIVSEYRIGILARRWGCRESLKRLNSDPAAAKHKSPYDFATIVQCSAPHHAIALSQARSFVLFVPAWLVSALSVVIV